DRLAGRAAEAARRGALAEARTAPEGGAAFAVRMPLVGAPPDAGAPSAGAPAAPRIGSVG
ncbi:sensor histidine kinase, partial [Frankia sp. CNm7]|nr:sensor histidine kinase [Frankia nepalensis]